MLQDEFKPIPHKVLTIGRSPKESVTFQSLAHGGLRKSPIKRKGVISSD